jgi:7-carboxy-7-deazaguanine synthase
MKAKVNEIFISLQGESTWMGRPTVFVRFAGCNLNCPWCDTQYAKKEFKEMDIESVVEEIKEYNCRYICFTGGEPLLQYEELINISEHFPGYHISVETNGSIEILQRPNIQKFVMDIKCPSSMVNKDYYRVALKNVENLNHEDEVKFVVATQSDLSFIGELLDGLPKEIVKLISPAWPGTLTLPDLAVQIVDWRTHNVLLQIQQHKIIWGTDKRGV